MGLNGVRVKCQSRLWHLTLTPFLCSQTQKICYIGRWHSMGVTTIQKGHNLTAKILMVDDEPDAELLFRQNFRREMRKQKYEFLFAQSGEAALELLGAEEQPEVLVVLSDINMPGMDGMDLLDEVKERWPEMPVIMISAYGDPGTEAKAKQKGADQLVSKPVDFQQLKVELATMALQAAT